MKLYAESHRYNNTYALTVGVLVVNDLVGLRRLGINVHIGLWEFGAGIEF